MEPLHEFGKEAMENEQRRLANNRRMSNIFKGVAVVVAVAAAVFFRGDIQGAFASSGKTKKEKKQEKEIADVENHEAASSSVTVVKKWELPDQLMEISGLSYINGDRFACVQDELGTVFIYNTGSSAIEKEIPFGKPGDYEGLAMVGETAWVVRSDGHLFEVNNINAAKPVVKEYSTPLTAAYNIEGLCYDKNNNRLLLAMKDDDPKGRDYKGIYGFDLSTRTLSTEPVYKIDLTNELLSGNGGKKKKNGVMPSAIAINPQNGDLYITDGPKSKLLVMDNKGNIKNYYQLGGDFKQPEGISFKPGGELFISNEGSKQPGNIIEVKVN